MSNDRIRGVMVPAITPLSPDERVDTKSLRRVVNYLIDSGVHGIWAAGTTGEFAALADDQRLTAIETVVDEVAGRVPVVANVSLSSTQLSVDLAGSVHEMGVDGIALTPPYYYNHAQDELLDHYRYVKDRSGVPLWVYNIPVTVKTVVEPETIAQMAAEGTVVGVKDSSGAGELLGQLNLLCDQGDIELYRFLGTVYRIASTRAVGGHGVIPAIGNLVPASAAKAWEAGEAGDTAVANEHLANVIAATAVFRLAKGGGPNASTISGMKSALKLMGVIDHDTVTRPLRPLADEEQEQIPAILIELGLDH